MQLTDKKLEANRLNAQKSTGPRSEEGKAVARMNAVKHGLRAETIVLPEESQEDFDTLYSRLTGHFQPANIEEEHKVEQMAIHWWRAGRAGRMIDGIFRSSRAWLAKYPPSGDPTPAEAITQNAATDQYGRDAILKISALETRYEHSYEKARKELHEIRKERKKTARPESGESEPKPVRKPVQIEHTSPEPVAISQEIVIDRPVDIIPRL